MNFKEDEGNKNGSANTQTPQSRDIPIPLKKAMALEKILPKTGDISAATVCEVFNTLISSMTTVKEELSNEIKELKEEKFAKATKMETIKLNQTTQTRKITKLEQEKNLHHTKLIQLSDTVAYQSQVIQELQNKLKAYLIVQGITEEVKRDEEEDCIEVMKSFFKSMMGISKDMPMKRAYMEIDKLNEYGRKNCCGSILH